jgi:predicted aconitase
MTPEAGLMDIGGLETIDVTGKEIEETYGSLCSAEDPDIVILGCPHASLREIGELAGMLEGKTLAKPLWICTSRVMKEAAERMGYLSTIESAGGKVVADTCMVVSPIEQMGYSSTGTNSGKAANYLPGFCKQQVVFQNAEELVRRQLA